MTTKADFILNEALSMNPAERARIAHCLISSLDMPAEENVDEAWLKHAEQRFAEIERGDVTPVSWEDIEKKVRA
jgi:putative addiction module component (TIGR02574 family)